MATTIKYPHITVELTGGDGNAFAIISAVSRAMRRAKVPMAEIEAFRKEAMRGDYDHVLQTCLATVDVE